MNEIKDNGGPAFPEQFVADGVLMASHSGMSIRDWFAGMALQGIISGDQDFATEGYPSALDVTHMAYKYADAMLAERNKE